MSTSRRKFIKQSSILTVATTIVPLHACSPIKNTIRFGLTTDSHYADREDAGTRYYRQSLNKMQEFVEVMNTEKVDFVIHLGDFKDEDLNKKEADTLHYLRQLESEYAKFQGSRFHCVGNHDVDSITKEQFLLNVENTGISNNKSYYSFNKNGFHFIVLDANFNKDGSHHFFKEGSDWLDTNLTQKQINWLKEDLKNTQLPTIVFCHHPLFEYYHDGNKYHINDFKEVQQILETSKKVLAVFQGHIHNEEFREINNIHYITQFGMVDYSGLENNSFAIVELTSNSLKVEGFKRTSKKVLGL